MTSWGTRMSAGFIWARGSAFNFSKIGSFKICRPFSTGKCLRFFDIL